jgi:D-glycero-alpha-D-manno-heptose-7-phosphate kinase
MLLIARAPVRISFGGGGTDLEAYYRRYGGMVINATINKYFYTVVSEGNPNSLQIISSDYHTFYRYLPHYTNAFLWDGQLELPRAVIDHFGLSEGLNIFMASEIPPGTGLGSSSTVAVALIKALSLVCEQELSKRDIAELAAYIEIQKLGMPIGKQDQYAAAFGGLNCITFTQDGQTITEPVAVSFSTLRRLERNLLLIFTGISRDSSSILKQQRRSSEKNERQVIESLHAIKAIAQEIKECLRGGDLAHFGELLHLSWQQKKKLAPKITNPDIDRFYDVARAQGALGGKISGAGGGGFLMLYCERERQQKVIEALSAEGLKQMDFQFDFQGVQLLLNTLAFGVRCDEYSERYGKGGTIVAQHLCFQPRHIENYRTLDALPRALWGQNLTLES